MEPGRNMGGIAGDVQFRSPVSVENPGTPVAPLFAIKLA
jgi:hypothetical protein